MSAPHRNLPIGIQTFSQIISGNYYYVDKTAQIARLLQQDKYYFLSRPRRFGKSLLLDTLKELLECNEPLFRGLAIHGHWNWAAPTPVIEITFNDGGLENRHDLEQRMLSLLRQNSQRLGLAWQEPSNPVDGLRELIHLAYQKYGQRVAILVDEYDKPVLDHITSPAIALAMRECLKGFYSVIKGADAKIRFAFITGVSKFSKVSLFSGLNNLRDITLTPEYSALCGYTDVDLDTVFAAELVGLDRVETKNWYNGYNWLGESVYNPYDILLLLRERKFRAWWFESGTPSFLIKLLTERQTWLPTLGNLKADAELLSTFDVDTIPTTALMFQAGYLTIAKEELVGGNYYYSLRFPNREVEQSLYGSLLRVWADDAATQAANKQSLYALLAANDLPALKNLFQAFFAGIPHQWFDNNPIAKYEGYYASVFYAYFVAAGLQVQVEDATNLGRIDMSVRLAGQIYLFEFKVVESQPNGKALQQIKDKGYADKYCALGQAIHLIGVEFARDTRNVVGFEIDTILLLQ